MIHSDVLLTTFMTFISSLFMTLSIHSDALLTTFMTFYDVPSLTDIYPFHRGVLSSCLSHPSSSPSRYLSDSMYLTTCLAMFPFVILLTFPTPLDFVSLLILFCPLHSYMLPQYQYIKLIPLSSRTLNLLLWPYSIQWTLLCYYCFTATSSHDIYWMMSCSL